MPLQHVRLTREQNDALADHLWNSIDDIIERRQARVQRWQRWREQYEGKTTPKNFPWQNASNIHVPQTAIDTDAIHANMMNRIHAHERVWDVSALKPTEKVGINQEDGQPVTWTDLANAVQDYMKFESGPTGFMDVYNATEETLLECIKLGTSVIYNPWVTLTQPDYVLDETGTILTKEPRVIFDGLKPQNIPLEDFLVAPSYPEIHGPFGAPLFGHQYWLRRGQVIARSKEGKYRDHTPGDVKDRTLARILRAPGGTGEEDLKDHQARQEGENTTYMDDRGNWEYQFQDMWIKHQLDPNQPEVHLYVVFHHETRTIARVQPWIYKTPPYHVFRYLRREGRFYGIGIPEMLEAIQKGINTSMNQTVDNATIANIRCFKVKAGTRAARMFTDIYPGKKLFVDNTDDIEDFQLGEVYPSAFQVGLTLRDYAERRTGITDFNLGRDDSVNRQGTATTTMALLQEGARRFDLYAKDIRRAIGEMGMQSIELIQQHKPNARIFGSMDSKKAALVERALGLPQAVNIREWLKVTATSAGSMQNKETQRQNAVSAFSMLVQYLQQVFELATVIANPQIPPGLRKLAYDMSQTGERLMQKVLEGFDMPDMATFLPQLEGLIGGQNEPQGAVSGQAALGGPAGPADGTQGGASPGLATSSGSLGPGTVDAG